MSENDDEFFWTGEDCPHCDEGTLGQQDRFNVMCAGCMEIFEHRKNESEHYLFQTDRGATKTKPVDQNS